MRIQTSVRRIITHRNLLRLATCLAMVAIAKLLFSSKVPKKPARQPPLELTLSLAPSIPSLLEISLDDIRLELEKESFTAVDLVYAYTKRIQEVDHVFRSVLEVNPEAASIA